MPAANGPARTAELELPRPPTPFIGRKRLLAVLRDLFATGERLVTLTGASGVGKTRLALELGAARSNTFPGGVLFCDLTERADADGVTAAVAATLGLATSAQGPDTVAEALARRGKLLLILDNFEHLVDAAADTVGQWHARCPDASFLVTSRELLRLEGEVVVELPPLDVTGDEGGRSEAMQLWIERRRRLEPDYLMTPEEAPIVDAIVRALDGIPLALELAAARASLLGPRELLARLEKRFEVLGHGPRGGSPRHATLHAAIDWSWNLLSDWEKDALAQSSVFRGGFDVEAAEQVIDLEAHADAPPVLDVLQALRDKSLIRSLPPAGTDTPRLGLFISIRDYAAKRLKESGGEDAAVARHRDWYIELAEQLGRDMDGPDGARALDRLAGEQDNLRAVVERGGPAAALRALVALDDLLWTRGPVGAHLEALDKALGEAERTETPPGVVARGLEARAMTRVRLGRMAEGVEDMERALERATESGRDEVLARVLSSAAWIDWRSRNLERMEERLDRGRELARKVGDRKLEGAVVGTLGAVSKERGDYRRADALYREALAIHREGGNRRYEGQALTRLAILHLEEGRLEDVHEEADTALHILRAFGDRYLEGLVLTILGAVHHAEERLEEARTVYESAIPIHRSMGEQRVYGSCLGYLGVAELESGDLELAVEHLQEARTALEAAADPRHAALFTAFLAGVEASLVGLGRAERRLASAEKLVEEARDEVITTLVQLQRGHLDLAAAREAKDPAEERRLIAAAKSRLALADAEDTQGQPLSARSLDVRIAARILGRALDAQATTDTEDEEALIVHPFGHWFRPPGGEPADLRRRQAMRRLLVRLTHQRLHRPGVPLAADTLLSSGWPGERMTAESAHNRLYVTLNRLRDLGLRGLLSATGEGYMLDPETPTRFAASDEE